jgi:type II restriction/modification system DNA methylase subunit YeeA
LVRPEYHAFFESAYVPICAFTLFTIPDVNYAGSFIDLTKFYGADLQPIKVLEAIQNPNCGWFYRKTAEQFIAIPGSPIAYEISDKVREIFQESPKLEEFAQPCQGLATADNDRFLRLWYEVAKQKTGFGINSREDAKESHLRWFPYNKGGEFRKWYGNNEYLVNWEDDGKEIRSFYGESGKLKSRPQNMEYYFSESITWSFVSSSYFGVRYSKPGAIFDVGGSSVFPPHDDAMWLTGFLCSKLSTLFLNVLNPTLNFQVGNVATLPIVRKFDNVRISQISSKLVSLSENDWNSFETSWDFGEFPLLRSGVSQKHLAKTYQTLRQNWIDTVKEFGKLETENNRLFINAYGLQDELSPEVLLEEVTLTCNPKYHYAGNRNDEELEDRLLADMMKEFISYAVGCMFGRYSLDKPGLVLANQGETLKDYLKQVPKPTFLPDEDNVIPVLEDEWFEDDIAERFKKFLRVTFGEEHYDENLAFIEESIGRDVRSYFVKEFYKDHVQTYKKRPIYWMFSSPKGSFNALIYMHRYQPDTVSIVLNGYLREYIKKLTAHKSQLERTSVSSSASQSQKTKALKEITQVNKVLSELKEYEDEVLYPLATEQVKIDLDDGVKVNYGKFGSALAKITGL